MAREELHIFICYGVRSLDAAVRISRNLAPESVLLLVMFDGDLREVPSGVRVSVLNTRRYSEWTRPFRVAAWYERERAWVEKRRASVVAYVPHPFELPGNDLVYSNPSVVRRELLPDGLINLTSAPHRPKTLARRLRYEMRVFLRQLSARIVGLRYRRLKEGHITQVNSVRYDRVWGDSEQGLPSCTGVYARLPERNLPIASDWKPTLGTRVLVLDQELKELMNGSLEERVRLRMVDLVACLGGEVFYKAHPRGKNRVRDLGLAAIDVTSAEQAEALVRTIYPTCVVSFYSTALLDPELEKLERIAILPELGSPGVKRPELLTETWRLLESRGVRVVSVS